MLEPKKIIYFLDSRIIHATIGFVHVCWTMSSFVNLTHVDHTRINHTTNPPKIFNPRIAIEETVFFFIIETPTQYDNVSPRFNDASFRNMLFPWVYKLHPRKFTNIHILNRLPFSYTLFSRWFCYAHNRSGLIVVHRYEPKFILIWKCNVLCTSPHRYTK